MPFAAVLTQSALPLPALTLFLSYIFHTRNPSRFIRLLFPSPQAPPYSNCMTRNLSALTAPQIVYNYSNPTLQRNEGLPVRDARPHLQLHPTYENCLERLTYLTTNHEKHIQDETERAYKKEKDAKLEELSQKKGPSTNVKNNASACGSRARNKTRENLHSEFLRDFKREVPIALHLYKNLWAALNMALVFAPAPFIEEVAQILQPPPSESSTSAENPTPAMRTHRGKDSTTHSSAGTPASGQRNMGGGGNTIPVCPEDAGNGFVHFVPSAIPMHATLAEQSFPPIEEVGAIVHSGLPIGETVPPFGTLGDTIPPVGAFDATVPPIGPIYATVPPLAPALPTPLAVGGIDAFSPLAVPVIPDGHGTPVRGMDVDDFTEHDLVLEEGDENFSPSSTLEGQSSAVDPSLSLYSTDKDMSPVPGKAECSENPLPDLTGVQARCDQFACAC